MPWPMTQRHPAGDPPDSIPDKKAKKRPRERKDADPATAYRHKHDGGDRLNGCEDQHERNIREPKASASEGQPTTRAEESRQSTQRWQGCGSDDEVSNLEKHGHCPAATTCVGITTVRVICHCCSTESRLFTVQYNTSPAGMNRKAIVKSTGSPHVSATW